MSKTAPKDSPDSGNHQFYLRDGKIIRHIHELPDHFDRMSEEVFAHHVNPERNDFSNWVRDVHGQHKLAEELRTANSRMSSKEAVLRHVSISTNTKNNRRGTEMRKTKQAVPAARKMPLARPMGRGTFLRGVGAAAVAGATTMAGVRPVRGQTAPTTHYVQGQSDVNVDAVNVQTAIEAANPGDTIVLQGEFYFSDYNATLGKYNTIFKATVTAPPEWFGDWSWYVTPFAEDKTVFINKSLTIKGERGADGAYLTKIRGGYLTFRIGVKPHQPNYNFFFDTIISFGVEAVPDVEVTVSDLEFDDAWTAAIVVGGSKNTTITRNKFTDGRGLPIHWIDFIGEHPPVMYQVIVGPVGGFLEPNTGNVTGQVNITDNIFDGKARVAAPDDPWGVEIFGFSWRGAVIGARCMGVEGNLNLTNNEFRGVSTYGFTSEAIKGIANLSNNKIHSMGIPQLGYGGENMIWVEDDNWGDGPYISTTTLLGNEITLDQPYNAWEAIELIYVKQAVVKSNKITFSGANDFRMGIGLWSCKDCVVSNNLLKGEASIGVVVTSTGLDTPDQDGAMQMNNLFLGNNIDNKLGGLTYQFGLPWVEPVIYPKGNVVKGDSGNVYDISDNPATAEYDGMNFITGLTSMKIAPATGKARSAAVQQIHDSRTIGMNRMRAGVLKFIKENNLPTK